MDRFVGIGEAADALGVSITTLRRWEASGRLVAEHTAGGHRRYDLSKLRPEMFRAEAEANRRTAAYARVSSHDQKDDLERQKQVLELYCARQGWTFEVIADLGSGMNYHKKGLKRLLDAVIDGQIARADGKTIAPSRFHRKIFFLVSVDTENHIKRNP
jgi:predicted site-specific integrase-resolvase